MRCQGTGRPERGDLVLRLLDAVLAQRADAGRDGGRMRSTSTVFETRDEEHVVRAATGALGSARDPLLHTLEVRRNVEHARF